VPTDDGQQPEEEPVAEVEAGALAPTLGFEPDDPGTWTNRELDGRYRIIRLLGEGGMGAVFVAEHLTLHKQVALKVIRAELAGNGEVATRFAREAMATAQFEHPHVASAIDYGTLPEGGAYFVMQLVRGQSLRAILETGQPLPWRTACLLLSQVADALSAARAAGIIHRDLKPDNILVESREDGSQLAKVLDFGIAHVAPRDAPAPEGAEANRELTRVGTVMGTPGYMAPEQAVGDRVDHRTDLYALGVVLWECISGRDLWDGPDVTAVISRQMSESVPTLRATLDDTSIPEPLDALIQQLTSRSIEDRPNHAGEVRDTLRSLAHSERGTGMFPAVSTLVPQLRSTLEPMVQRSTTRWQTLPPKTRRNILIGGAAAIALFFALSGSDDKTADAAKGRPAATAKEPAKGAAKAIETVVEAAEKAVKPAVAAVEAVANPDPPVPEAIAEEVKTMLESSRARDRRDAARKVLAYKGKPTVPEPLLVIAKLEKANGCRGRREVVREMEKAPAAQYVIPLDRLDKSPRKGCGFLSLKDCHSCMRSDVEQALDEVESKHPSARDRYIDEDS